MWFALWSVLVVGAVAVPVVLGLGLWRRVKALGREAAASAEALTPSAPLDRQGERSRATLLDPATPGRVRDDRHARRARRDARRARTLAGAVDRWARHGLV
ncbi:MAG: hypothetical protein EOL91_03705 [Actinobacteria bacterium]|nr:hypothetical protein [Actinomycetota bacterium]